MTGSTTKRFAKLRRLLRHRWLDDSDSRRALSDAALDRLQQQVARSEAGHSGEIRIVVEAGLPLSYLRRGLPARARAVTLFGKLRVWDTEHNNGVLIYLLLADRAIEIVADRALARCVSQPRWDELVALLGQALRAGRFEQGLQQAVKQVDGLLRAHFPRSADGSGPADANELSDRPLRL